MDSKFSNSSARPAPTICIPRILGLLSLYLSAHLCGYLDAAAKPTRSSTVEERGVMLVDAPLPWVSGWDLSGKVTNVTEILDQYRLQGSKGVYMILCATWSTACGDSLRLIQNYSGRLLAENINTIAVFVEDEQPIKIRRWLDKLGVAYGTHLKVVLDRYHRSAIRLGAYEERLEDVVYPNDTTKERERAQERVKRLRVPLGVVLSTSGNVLSIVTQEGADIIDHISRVVRYAGE